jgi:hypothetical protein
LGWGVARTPGVGLAMTYVSYEYLSVDWEIRRDVLELNFSDSMVDLIESGMPA